MRRERKAENGRMRGGEEKKSQKSNNIKKKRTREL